jgi:hypothetical protein
MASPNQPTVATPSEAYTRMAPRWALINAVLGGTEAMRAAGKTYLPQHAKESDDAYRERLERNVLKNMLEQTLDQLAGRPFKDGVKLNDDVPEQVKALTDDVNLKGDRLDVFCRHWFREGVAKAHCHVMVEYPRAKARPDGQPRTLADDREENLRPYWVLVPAEAMLFMETEVDGGVEYVTHCRILELQTERVGWGQRTVRRVRVLEPGRGELWEERKVRGAKAEWVRVEEWTTTLQRVPVVTFYTACDGPQEGKPPLMDLAYLNTAHWQSSSDQRNVLTVARFPMLAASGALPEGTDGSTKLVVGPNKWLHITDPSGKFYYVEHNGAAIEAGRKDLEDLENACSQYGAMMLQKQPGTELATVRALDTAESLSPLQAMVMVFEDAVAKALWLTAEWMSLEEGGTVSLTRDFAPLDPSGVGLQSLEAARTRKDISREAYINELQRRGVLDEEYDAAADQALIDEEGEKLMALGGTMQDLDPSAPPAPGEEEEGDGEKPGAKKPPEKE